MQEGMPYRVALSSDGTKIRRAPESEFDDPAMADGPATARRAEQTFDKVVAEVLFHDTSNADMIGDEQWITIATIKPDGTCRDDRLYSEDNGNQEVWVAVRERLDPSKEPSPAGIHVVIRGITGHVRIVTGTQQNAPEGQKP
jgi:hypothetical protein